MFTQESARAERNASPALYLPLIYRNLMKSQYAEQMVCSMSTQLFHIPETEDLKGNRQMHEHLIHASYHRTTAIGSADRLLRSRWNESIVATLASCIANGLSRDKKVHHWLLVMKNAADAKTKPFIEHILQWQNKAEYELKKARQHTIAMIGIDKWKAYQPQEAHE